MHKQKLTGWLILLIVWIVITGANGLGSLSLIEKTWRPHTAEYPSLRGAIMASQWFIGGGILTWFYAAWVLYQREPGTLKTAQIALLVGAVLRVFGGWSIVLFGRLPGEMSQRLASSLYLSSFIILLATSSWYAHLARSPRVRTIYARDS